MGSYRPNVNYTSNPDQQEVYPHTSSQTKASLNSLHSSTFAPQELCDYFDDIPDTTTETSLDNIVPSVGSMFSNIDPTLENVVPIQLTFLQNDSQNTAPISDRMISGLDHCDVGSQQEPMIGQFNNNNYDFGSLDFGSPGPSFWNARDVNECYGCDQKIPKVGAAFECEHSGTNFQPSYMNIPGPQPAMIKRLDPPKRYRTTSTSNSKQVVRPAQKRSTRSRGKSRYSVEQLVPQGVEKRMPNYKNEKNRQAVKKCRQKMVDFLRDAPEAIARKETLKTQLQTHLQEAEQIVAQLRTMGNRYKGYDVRPYP